MIAAREAARKLSRIYLDVARSQARLRGSAILYVLLANCSRCPAHLQQVRRSVSRRSCPKTSRSWRGQLGLAENVTEKRSSLGAAAAPPIQLHCVTRLPPSVACSFELAVIRGISEDTLKAARALTHEGVADAISIAPFAASLNSLGDTHWTFAARRGCQRVRPPLRCASPHLSGLEALLQARLVVRPRTSLHSWPGYPESNGVAFVGGVYDQLKAARTTRRWREVRSGLGKSASSRDPSQSRATRFSAAPRATW